MITQLNKSHLKQAEIQGNEAQNKRRESETSKMPIRQDRIIENQLQSGEMMIKNIQSKKENSKNELTLSEQYIHKKSIIQTQSQSGRSMVEMLGVLAIIGVLSIGGITGYKYAMNYYQANQIAHEINLMRTDAQVKIAQGADELVLGNPYDDGNINFNNYETDFDCVYMENEEATPELAFCNAANAYYIEMQNIPEGVCRPLANLIDKMDNEIAFYINKKSVDAEAEGEKGACNEEPNTLRVIFGADSDSDAIKCDDDTNCPPELPVCFNHMCVECTQEKGCEGKSQYCKDNTCKTCESGVWNGEKCVACTTSADCKNPTPICNENTCVACGNGDECHLKNPSEENCVTGGACCKDPLMTWNDNECVCPDDQPWNGEFCGCKSNDDCESNEFCLTSECTHTCYSDTLMEEMSCSGKIHKCVKISEYMAPNNSNSPYAMSNQGMNWWSAKRFCNALKMNMMTLSDLQCNDIFKYNGGEGTHDSGFCHASGSEVIWNLESTSDDVSEVVKAIRSAYNGNGEKNDPWLGDPYKGSDENSCWAYIFELQSAHVTIGTRDHFHNYHTALCKK